MSSMKCRSPTPPKGRKIRAGGGASWLARARHPLAPALIFRPFRARRELFRQDALEVVDGRGVAGAAQKDEGLLADFGLGVRLRDLDEERDGFGGGAAADGRDGLFLQFGVGVHAARRLVERAE